MEVNEELFLGLVWWYKLMSLFILYIELLLYLEYRLYFKILKLEIFYSLIRYVLEIINFKWEHIRLFYCVLNGLNGVWFEVSIYSIFYLVWNC